MGAKRYDIITVGGGLGGSAIAAAMANSGASVLVLEATSTFQDRVRGESILPWGVAEARELGIYGALVEAGAHELPWWTEYRGPEIGMRRNLAETTAQRLPAIGISHPALQGALIERAAAAGAEVRRGVTVKAIRTGRAPVVVSEANGNAVESYSRLVVGADGRRSMVRSAAGFHSRRDPGGNVVAGLLFSNMPAPDDSNHLWPNPSIGQFAIAFPQGAGRARVYHACGAEAGLRLSGDGAIPRFIEQTVACGIPLDYFLAAKPEGPLASFVCPYDAVDHPHRPGVVLIGDAATETDPSFGQGLSVTLRDVRVLRDKLLGTDDWEVAAEAYAAEHNRYVEVIRNVQGWMSDMLLRTGAEADARRAKALPLWEQDPTRPTDVLFSGPDIEIDETVRQRFYGEDQSPAA